MSETKNPEEILKPFKEALIFWTAQLTDRTHDFKSSVPAAKVDNPLVELTKLLDLIRAQSTKVGIVYEPATLRKQSDAAHNTASDLSRTFVLYMSALSQACTLKMSNLFIQEIVSASAELVITTLQFVDEISKLYKESQQVEEVEEPKTKNEVNPRLVSVGKLWSLCDSTKSLIQGGEVKLLEAKTRLHLSLIEDGLEDFAEWAENPEEVDDEDPFGLNDEFSDDEDAESDVPDTGSVNLDKESESTKELISYSKVWLQKLKLVKLLLLSIKKSVPTIMQGSDVDSIFRTEGVVSREIDMLIVELMMNRVVDHKVFEHAGKIDSACYHIISLLRAANKSQESKVKWSVSWEAKYKEFLEEEKKVRSG